MHAAGIFAIAACFIVLVLGMTAWVFGRSRAMLDGWAASNGLEIVSAQFRWVCVVVRSSGHHQRTRPYIESPLLTAAELHATAGRGVAASGGEFSRSESKFDGTSSGGPELDL